MTFNILKLAALGLVGWMLYRSFGTAGEQGEASGADGSGDEAAPDDVQAQSDAAAAQVESASSADAPAESTEAPAESPAETATVPAQDLSKIRGIGPAIATLLSDRGIATWSQLAETEVSDLQAILDEAGPRYRVHDPSTWPEQAAELAQAN